MRFELQSTKIVLTARAPPQNCVLSLSDAIEGPGGGSPRHQGAFDQGSELRPEQVTMTLPEN